MCMTNSRYKFEAEIKQINETHQMLNGWYRSKYPIGNDLSVISLQNRQFYHKIPTILIIILVTIPLYQFLSLFYFLVRNKVISFNT